MRYGKTDTDGKTQNKSFETFEEAIKEAEKLIKQKVKKGYMEDGSENASEKGNIDNFKKTDKNGIENILKSIENKKFNKTLAKFKNILLENDCYLYDGDLIINKDFYQPENSFLIINGKLEIKGNLDTSVKGSDDKFLIVLGDIVCDNLYVSYYSTLLIGGNLKVKELLYTSTADSVTCCFGEKIQAKGIYSGNGAGWLSALKDAKIECEYFSNTIDGVKNIR